MKLIIGLTAIVLVGYTMVASAYLCPAVKDIHCKNGTCEASTDLGVWVGSADRVVGFDRVVNAEEQIVCYYKNSKGDVFNMDNKKLHTAIMKMKDGPWQRPHHKAYCESQPACEFVTDPTKK